MKGYFGRRYMLSASHRLHTDALGVEENRAAYGKCNNPHGHGHNYVIEVLAGGAVDPETGMVVDLVAMDEAVRTKVLDRFDHVNLNLDPMFAESCPPPRICARLSTGCWKDRSNLPGFRRCASRKPKIISLSTAEKSRKQTEGSLKWHTR